MASCICKIGSFHIYSGDPIGSENSALKTTVKVSGIVAVFFAGYLLGLNCANTVKGDTLVDGSSASLPRNPPPTPSSSWVEVPSSSSDSPSQNPSFSSSSSWVGVSSSIAPVPVRDLRLPQGGFDPSSSNLLTTLASTATYASDGVQSGGSSLSSHPLDGSAAVGHGVTGPFSWIQTRGVGATGSVAEDQGRTVPFPRARAGNNRTSSRNNTPENFDTVSSSASASSVSASSVSAASVQTIDDGQYILLSAGSRPNSAQISPR
ncbi:MAG TPA: hypothetical protein VLE96_04305 [Chlamydiales bacterium]|nr:hypothetical protein [Chlamydiales bacterium]